MKNWNTWNWDDGTAEDGPPVVVVKYTVTLNVPKDKIQAEDWQRINSCCGPVERIEWAKGRFIYRCSECGRTQAMERDGIVTWKTIQ